MQTLDHLRAPVFAPPKFSTRSLAARELFIMPRALVNASEQFASRRSPYQGIDFPDVLHKHVTIAHTARAADGTLP
jgi:hypothetical protein